MIFSDFVNAPPSENGGLRRFLRRKNRIENEEGRGFGRGTALEQSESGAGQNIGPGGADDQAARFRGAKCDRMGASAGVLPLGGWRGGAVTGTAK